MYLSTPFSVPVSIYENEEPTSLSSLLKISQQFNVEFESRYTYTHTNHMHLHHLTRTNTIIISIITRLDATIPN